jgi:hypothetical protein
VAVLIVGLALSACSVPRGTHRRSRANSQVLTITHRFNPANLAEVRAWSTRQFDIRAYPTQAATVLLLLAGATVAAALLASPTSAPRITVTQNLPARAQG